MKWPVPVKKKKYFSDETWSQKAAPAPVVSSAILVSLVIRILSVSDYAVVETSTLSEANFEDIKHEPEECSAVMRVREHML